MSVGLAADVKGTHLSRFIELLHNNADDLTQQALPSVLRRVQERLGSDTAQLTLTFPYFLPRSAPVTGATALMDYNCSFSARAIGAATTSASASRFQSPASAHVAKQSVTMGRTTNVA